MKPLFALLALMLCCTFARADVATDLAALKAAFPEYVGPSSKARHDITDPYVKECIAKYQKTAASLTAVNLKGNIAYLNTQLERDIQKYEEAVATSSQAPSTGGTYLNAKSNAYWLKKKVKPWVAKLEAVAAS